ncbi:ABC transporter ATP-binding protein [Flagellimonas allohymeniacidonis]|uniref:ABC transporter ATP-binding protein n=1 Tax=Flagellimonas allohymeniacidonis TaxID=2517819 RepID=A0A4Q8QFX0_9FLAO|nr:ATP-binding cassette domain-containing protein [Allomuricauda hymeniacidonis]TAI49442.1 ABC transporter ATP-binding protein [Allomuricauda hymeniacidonis]
MQNILVADAVSKSYGNYRALGNISLEIPKNRIYGLLGPNGAGKTTFIRIINQITYPDEGRIFFDGNPLSPGHISLIGYLPEERGLYKSMKVGEQALYLAQLKGLGKSEAKKRLKEWFDRFEIGEWWGKKVQELSKGMAQKIQFIVTVLHEPKLLIFDEPFSGFDPINANIIKDEILKLKEKGTSIIFSTHRMESVEELCEYIALIHKSEKVLDGKLSEIKKAYKNNVFEVSMEMENGVQKVSDFFDKKLEILASNFDQVDRRYDLKVKLPSNDTRGILTELTKYGNVTRFEEVIPSANDIFIQTVNEKEGNG